MGGSSTRCAADDGQCADGTGLGTDSSSAVAAGAGTALDSLPQRWPVCRRRGCGKGHGCVRARGLQPRTRNAESSTPDGYWVYVENLKDAAARRKVISTLNAAGMKDAAVMDEAERVSVGVFSDQRHAVHRAEQVQELGFKPTLSVHQRTTSTPWLDLDLKASDQDPALEGLELGSGKGADPIKVIDCPAKASVG